MRRRPLLSYGSAAEFRYEARHGSRPRWRSGYKRAPWWPTRSESAAVSFSQASTGPSGTSPSGLRPSCAESHPGPPSLSTRPSRVWSSAAASPLRPALVADGWGLGRLLDMIRARPRYKSFVAFGNGWDTEAHAGFRRDLEGASPLYYACFEAVFVPWGRREHLQCVWCDTPPLVAFWWSFRWPLVALGGLPKRRRSRRLSIFGCVSSAMRFVLMASRGRSFQGRAPRHSRPRPPSAAAPVRCRSGRPPHRGDLPQACRRGPGHPSG